MPLNPNISLAYKGIELQNPMDQYAKMMQIQQAQQQNRLAEMKVMAAEREQENTNALNRIYAESYDPETGELDINKFRKNAMAGNLGSQVPEFEEKFYKTRSAKSEASGKQEDALQKALKTQREFLDTIDPTSPYALQKTLRWHQSNHAHPLIGARLKAIGIDPEQSTQEIITTYQKGPQAFAQHLARMKLGTEKFMDLNKPTTMQINRGGQTDLIQVPGMGGAPTTVGTYADVPKPEGVYAQEVAKARAGATSVHVSTDKAYGGAIGKLAAEEDIALHQKAQAIPTEIKKVDETLNVLRNSDINTGLGAEVFTVLDQAKAQFTDDKKAGKRVTDTQYLDSLLGSSVFPQISALGIGARGLDTPAEREFLRKVITGTISLNKDTLIKMTELRRRGLQDAATVYNNKVKSGELDRFFEGTGRSRALIELPEAPTAKRPAPAVKAPSGVDPALWNAMTPQERALWQK